MNIFHELGRLQVQAEGHPVADGIAEIRRVLILDTARRRVGTAMDQARPKKGARPDHQKILIAGRVVIVPPHVADLLMHLPLDGSISRPTLAARVYGRADRPGLNRVTANVRTLDSVLRTQQSGLSILSETGRDGGYTLLTEPLTLAQAEAARAVS